MRQCIHSALDQVRCLGYAEGATVGDTAGGFVGVDGIHIDEGMLEVVRAGADVEQPGGELGRLGRCIKCAVVGQCVHTQCFDIPIFVCSELRGDMVVATPTCAAQVLGAVFNPLNRLAC